MRAWFSEERMQPIGIFLTFYSKRASHQRCNRIYQSPLILTELFQHDLINFSYLTACYLYQVMMTLHFFNDVAYDAESTQTSKLRHNRFEESSTMGKLINRIPGSRLLISSLPGSALRTHVESLGKPRDVNMRSQSLAW